MAFSRHIEKRLEVVIEKLSRFMTTYKTFKIRTKKEGDKIIAAELKKTKKHGDIIDIPTLIILIDCKKYDGKIPRK